MAPEEDEDDILGAEYERREYREMCELFGFDVTPPGTPEEPAAAPAPAPAAPPAPDDAAEISEEEARAYWAAREKLLQEQQRPWWRRKLQAEATKRSYGTDNYKGTTWGVAVGAQEDQNYPIGGLRCYYTVKGGIAGGWALAVDEPQINKASNNQKAILCPEGQNKFCVRTDVLNLNNVQCGWTEFYGDRQELTPNEDSYCTFKKCAST